MYSLEGGELRREIIPAPFTAMVQEQSSRLATMAYITSQH
jgi:hypothetical protein